MQMKLVVVTLVIMILLKCSYIQTKSSASLNDPNIFKCKICTEMVDIDFNYDSLIGDEDKLNRIKNYFSQSLGIDEKVVNEQLGRDNLEFVTKEISMQYFFKGSESSNNSNIKECKAVQTEKCQKLKNNLCEDVLAIKTGGCDPTINNRDDNKIKTSDFMKKRNLISNSRFDNSMDKIAILSKNSKNSGGLDLNSLMNDGKNIINTNYSNKLKLSKPKAINNPPKFRQINSVREDFTLNEDASQFNNISLIDVSPPQLRIADLIEHEAHDDVKKTFWSPPKPVLLDNFQNNLGTQLKDISLLTTYGRV
jgi:hypothetical protein